jgi:hypothetical protein
MKLKIKTLTVAAAGLALSLISADCGNPFTVSKSELKPGGVYVAYNLGCKTGCSEIKRGDLIQKVDGAEVKTADEFEGAKVTDGQPHKLSIFRPSEKSAKEVEIVADPDNSMPEFKDAPPFWTVGAAQLNKAPDWARRRLFGHAMPQLQLTASDGGFITGRQFRGKRHMVVMFDWAAQSDRLNGATFMQMLQKAQADLKNAGYNIVFAQVPFPSERQRPPMNDTDLRKYFNDNQLTKKEGGPLPAPPLYRVPNTQEENAARNVGMEGSFTVLEAIGQAPAILITDDEGIIRWHSAGLTPDPTGKLDNEAVYTMNKAILFALEEVAKE